MKKYLIISILLHGSLFLQFSRPSITKDMGDNISLVKQSIPVSFTQMSKHAPVAVAPNPVVEKPKEDPKPEPPKTIPKKTIPKKDAPKEAKKETKETPKPQENRESGIPNIDNVLTANADGTYNAVSNHGIRYKIIKEISPEYPKQAENIRYRKIVMVKAKFLVDQSGNVSKISIIKSHSNLGFDQAVRDALAKWKFAPIIYKGKAISVYFQKEFIFEPKS